MLMNVRGFRSKRESVKRILKKEKPAIVILNETQMLGRSKVDLKPFTSWSKNRTEKGGGGITTAVSPHLAHSAVGVGEGEQGDEYLVTRLEAFTPALTIINCYGEQRKVGKEVVEAKWGRLRKAMEEVRARGELCLLVGDLNKLVGCDEWGVEGNHPEVSPGGRLLREMFMTREWVLVNSLGEEVVQGGPHTRVDPATSGMSCLDLFIVSKELRPYVSGLLVDSARAMTPARVVTTGGRRRMVYSDHYSCVLTLSGLPRAQNKAQSQEKVARWNLAKEDGWKKYKELTDIYSKKLEEIDDDMDIEGTYKKFEDIHNKIKFKAFGKVTLKTTAENTNEEDKDETEEETLERIWKEQERRADIEVKEISMKSGKLNKIWELRKRIVGNKKDTMQATAIVNPNTKKIEVTKCKIKSISLQHCIETLKNNEADKDFEETINKKIEKVQKLVKENDGDFQAEKEIFERLLDKFKRSGKANYHFLTRAGEQFQSCVFRLCQKMIKQEVFPAEFDRTTLHMIFKGGNGRREVLSDNRFIHCKPWFPRLVEGLVVEGGLREALLGKSSMYQVGGQPGHRTEELVFSIKSIMAKYKVEKKPLLLQMFDISKYFDKETIEDAVLTCENRAANKKATRLWFKLNQKTKIQVRTGVGMSEEAEVGAVLGQGTLGGALISQAVLDDGVMEHFTPGEEGEVQYGGVPLAPLMYQDDLLQGVEGVEEARRSCRRVDTIMKELRLTLNQGKSVVVVVGNKAQRQQIHQELLNKPLMSGEVETQEKETWKWLGQIMSGKGLGDSIVQTISAREGKIRGASLEIAQICNDWRARAVGGLDTALLLWEVCVVPSLLHGCGTWVAITAAMEKRLNDLQLWFARLALQVGKGTPRAALTWETGLMDMKLRIWIEKLMLVLHIRSLEETSLARQIYEEQTTNKWPGLVQETTSICTNLNIEDCNTTNISKKDYKYIVTEACKKKDEEIKRKEAEGNIKCKRIMNDSYGRKNYIKQQNIKVSREYFRTRVSMHRFAGNYRHDPAFGRTGGLCRCLTAREEEQHLTSGNCPCTRTSGSSTRTSPTTRAWSTCFERS